MGNWRGDLETWLAPFVAALGHKTRGRLCPAYVAGLIGPGDRKSVQPMAARGGAVSYDQLHHFIADGVWDSAPLEAALRPRPIGWLVARKPFWSSMIHVCRRRASARSGLRRNMPHRWVKPLIASRLSR